MNGNPEADDSLSADIRERLAAVQRRVEDACSRSGRDATSVTIVGVTKRKPPEVIAAAWSAGIEDIGENYVQELVEKQQAIDVPVRWHYIGHLQRNKVKYIAPFVEMIHAVDSERLGREINRQAVFCGRTIPVLLQVNTSGEPSKYGVEPDAAADLAESLASLEHVELRGLMTLAAYLDDPEATRPMFRMLRTLREEIGRRIDGSLPFLSMGMTNDFEVAIEEGATHVRVGTALFGARQ